MILSPTVLTATSHDVPVGGVNGLPTFAFQSNCFHDGQFVAAAGTDITEWLKQNGREGDDWLCLRFAAVTLTSCQQHFLKREKEKVENSSKYLTEKKNIKEM